MQILYKADHFFKSSNRMIHPSVFLILRQSKVSDVIMKTEQSVNTGSNAIKWWDFAFFDELWIKEMHT